MNIKLYTVCTTFRLIKDGEKGVEYFLNAVKPVNNKFCKKHVKLVAIFRVYPQRKPKLVKNICPVKHSKVDESWHNLSP